jgi:hypothetical protein
MDRVPELLHLATNICLEDLTAARQLNPIVTVLFSLFVALPQPKFYVSDPPMKTKSLEKTRTSCQVTLTLSVVTQCLTLMYKLKYQH